jgi:hypothetical protein
VNACGRSSGETLNPVPDLEKEKQLNLEKLSPEKKSRLDKQRKRQISKLMKRNSKRVAQVSRLKKRNARLRARYAHYSRRRYRLADVVAEKALRMPRGLLRSLKRRITA